MKKLDGRSFAGRKRALNGERQDGRVMMRRCHRCSGWSPRKTFRKAAGCLYGFSWECRLCYNDRKKLNMRALRSKAVA